MTISTLDSISDAAWRPWAACADLGPAPFYGRPSKSICAACPASEPCLWAALAQEALVGYRYGMWGGTSAHRRRRIAAQLGAVDYHSWYFAVVASWSPPALANRRRPTVPRTPVPITVDGIPPSGVG